jgi:hypothetical protein
MPSLSDYLVRRFSRSVQNVVKGNSPATCRRVGLRVEQLETREVFSGNPIVTENQLPGNPASQWDISGIGDPSIQGFATDISVDHGQTVSFKVNDTARAPYHIDIYRIGYYGGMGARMVTSIPSSQTGWAAQPAPLFDPTTRLTDAGNWSVTASWAVPSTAVTGVYIAKLIREDTGGASHIIFVVRDDEGASDLLFQTSDETWQAYNNYGGYSLYGFNSTGGVGAYKVSYNRPFNTRTNSGGRDFFFGEEYPTIRFMEANGYNVSYFTGLDAARSGAGIKAHKVYLSVGHDEYWSGDQRANVEAARAAGVNLAFLSGDEMYWKTRWEPSIDGTNTAYRTLVCYKESTNGLIDPSSLWTGAWADPSDSPPEDGGRPQNALTGTYFTVNRGPGGETGTSFTVPAAYASLRLWRNTSVSTLQAGQTATLGDRVLGYEWDEDVDNGSRPAGLFDLSSTTQSVSQKIVTYSGTTAPGAATHSLTLYRAASGALVFGAGTINWAWGLDGTHDVTTTVPDLAMRQAMINLFADMQAQPGSLQSDLVAATPSTDKTPPTAAITSPANGASLSAGSPINITGTASDAGGGVVAAVEVSIDGGTTWHPAAGRSSWSYQWVPGAPGQYTLLTRAVDDSGNLGPNSAAVTVTILVGDSHTLWPASATPATASSSDGSAVELGLKFTADVAGVVTGVRFYKGPTNSGTHVAHLWTAGGTLLASATFTGESATGWQQVNFTSPVSVQPNTTYVVSYYAPSGGYAFNGGYFASSGLDNSPLHALSNTAAGGNGVYLYGVGGGFPVNSFNSANYWVDPVFAVVTDTTPPTVTVSTPAAGATGVPTTTSVAATFSKAVQPSTITFQLSIASEEGNQVVPATLTYNAATLTATLTPNVPLVVSTTYTVVIVGAADLSGNVMAPVTWTFTTASTATPYTLWPTTASPTVASANDASAIEVGTRFQPSSGGTVTGLRFYKGSANTGTHVGHLWDAAGNLLATVTFSGESASGWQQATFSSPVAVTAGTTYVVSYYAPGGGYSYTPSYFASAYTAGPLTAPAGGNGVYRYGAGGGFPTNSFNSTNYWVDVLFTITVDTTPPTVTATSPASGATGVAATVAVTATFSEPVQAGTIVFTLKDAVNNTVAATVTYDPATRTATLTPSAALQVNATYTATVSGAQDLAGNTMTAVSWSFTTAKLWLQTTSADFGTGTLSGTTVTATGDGGVSLAVGYLDDFTGTSLDTSRWTTGSWTSSGGGATSITVSGGLLHVLGGQVSSVQPVLAGALEGQVQFAPQTYQHFGLATSMASVSGNAWAVFSTMNTTTTLFARLNAGGTETVVNLGALPAGFHDYKIVPTGTGYEFWVDGTRLTTIAGTIPTPYALRAVASDFAGNPALPLVVDWVRVPQYGPSGTFVSVAFDAGATATWGTVTWTATVPAGTGLVVETSTTNDPNGTWSPWAAVTNGGTAASPAGRYIRYRVTFTTSNPTAAPELLDLAIRWT